MQAEEKEILHWLCGVIINFSHVMYASYMNNELHGNICERMSALVGQCWLSTPECMLSAALEDAIINQIKLHTRPLSIHNEQNVVCFQYLVVPAWDPKQLLAALVNSLTEQINAQIMKMMVVV